MDLSTALLWVGATFSLAFVMGMVTERWRKGDDVEE